MEKRTGEQQKEQPAMEIEHSHQEVPQQPQPIEPKAAKKDLLRFEKPHFDVFSQDKYANEKEFMIRKLIEDRKKPKFELLPTSSLLAEVRSFIPLLKEANKQVQESTVDVRIDRDLQLEQSSSEQSSSEEVEKLEESNDTFIPVEETHDHSLTNRHIEMVPLVATQNILVAKIPDPQEQPPASDKPQSPNHQN